MSACDIKGGQTYLAKARYAAGYTSRLEAAIHVPYSAVAIGRHERGEVRLSPDDVIVYANAYEAPGILMTYCRSSCPIGLRIMSPVASEFGIAAINTRLSNRLRQLAVSADKLAEIADDDRIDSGERQVFDSIVNEMRSVRAVMDELELYALKDKKRPAHTMAQ